MSSRARILAAIRAATTGTSGTPQAPSVVDAPPLPQPKLLDLFSTRIEDYRATVTSVADAAAVAPAITKVLRRHDARRVAIPGALPEDLRPGWVVELAPDDPPLDHATLSQVDGVVTTVALAIAQTGTIVLDHGAGQGRRALTLLPDLHVCVIRADQIVHTVPEAFARLGVTTRPLTFISGPSATSDIELDRVEGVHGPRRLEVVLVG